MSFENIGIITQARMTSTRLPGKILKTINGTPLLKFHIERLKLAECKLILATTVNDTDDTVSKFAEFENILIHRGSENNVLERFYQAADKYKLDVIVRVTSDCPLIDGLVIKEALGQYQEWNNPRIYYSNCLVRTFPRGFDFEIFSFELLQDAFINAKELSDFEHVTPYINKNKSGNVIIKDYVLKNDFSNFRLTVDTPEDFQLIELLVDKYGAEEKGQREIIDILLKNPELSKINAHIEQKKV